MGNGDYNGGDAFGSLFSVAGCGLAVALLAIWVIVLAVFGALSSAIGWLLLPVLWLASLYAGLRLLVNDVNSIGK